MSTNHLLCPQAGSRHFSPLPEVFTLVDEDLFLWYRLSNFKVKIRNSIGPQYKSSI